MGACQGTALGSRIMFDASFGFPEVYELPIAHIGFPFYSRKRENAKTTSRDTFFVPDFFQSAAIELNTYVVAIANISGLRLGKQL